ncbi:acetylxylan esterase [Streptomyces sindenensis]|uniref:Acetylxylan esterase n=1 Tax=Streptomyces sindenensis TaxID=67363 RepID=A0ABW6EDB8_9ACTN
MQTIHHQIRRRMMTNAPSAGWRPPEHRPRRTGHPRKPTPVKTFASDFEHELRAIYPERFAKQCIVDDHLIDYTPVVYVKTPSQATPKDLSSALAQYLGQKYRSGATKSDITRLVLEKMRLVGVELVITDDAHFTDLSLKGGKVVNDHLKYIANHTAATFICTGVELRHSGLFLEGAGDSRGTQTAGRKHTPAHDPLRHPDKGREGRLDLGHHRAGRGPGPDGVHFARRAQAPALFSAGLMDPVCPPSTVYAAYHRYAAPKAIKVWPFADHAGGQGATLPAHLRWLQGRGLAPTGLD